MQNFHGLFYPEPERVGCHLDRIQVAPSVQTASTCRIRSDLQIRSIDLEYRKSTYYKNDSLEVIQYIDMIFSIFSKA